MATYMVWVSGYGVTSKYQIAKQFDVSALITRRSDIVPGFRWRRTTCGEVSIRPYAEVVTMSFGRVVRRSSGKPGPVTHSSQLNH
jgi:hypothetical protein